MATNTNGIATISDVLKIQGVTISGTYDANQCIKYSDITEAPIPEIIPKTKITFDFAVESQAIMKGLTLYIESLGMRILLDGFAMNEDYYGATDMGAYYRNIYLSGADEISIHLDTIPQYDYQSDETIVNISIDGNTLFRETWGSQEIIIDFTLPANNTTLNYTSYNNILLSYFKDIEISMWTN